VTCHTRELAHQIFKDFKRLGRYFKKPDLRCGAYFGGVPLEDNIKEFKDPNRNPHIIIATPGRLLDLASNKVINFSKCKFFVIDECDKVIGSEKMRADIQKIFVQTPHNKQVMMFSATMPE
jgi:ATP-dependent RNA helicase UAP56/SUB2